MKIGVVACMLFNAFGVSVNFPRIVMGNSKPLPHASFLRQPYNVIDDKGKYFMVRQVPGDGACLFHSVSTWLKFIRFHKHDDFDEVNHRLSNYIRTLSVDVLLRNESLCVENEYMNSYQMVSNIAAHYNSSYDKYLNDMLHPKTWGGGPEIVALANHFQCPISVYQLTHQVKGIFNKKQQFCLELASRFGHPAFQQKESICLLNVDGRFPDVDPGKQLAKGDHFMALFPCTSSGQLLEVDTSQFQTSRCQSFEELCSRAQDNEGYKNNVMKRLRRVVAFRKRHAAVEKPESFKDV